MTPQQAIAGSFVVGNHLYAICADCGGMMRLTGWFSKWHLCLTEQELAQKRAVMQQARSQQQANQYAKATGMWPL